MTVCTCVRARVCKCVMVRVHTCDCVRGCVNSGFHSTSPLHRGRARLSGCFRAHTAAGSAETAKGWGGRCLVGGPAAPVGGIGLLGLLLVPCWVLPCHRGGWGAARWAGSFSPVPGAAPSTRAWPLVETRSIPNSGFSPCSAALPRRGLVSGHVFERC